MKEERCAIHIIGGASGVGKTSLLKSYPDIKQINTGDLFKLSMLLGSRDEIRKGDWSMFEIDVATRMINIVSECVQVNHDLIIDTHFAAKIYNKQYRIGLKEEYLYQFGESILKLNADKKVIVNIILISVDPYLLLTRRRLDKHRNRELVPSDCYNDIRSNNVYSYRYSSAIRKKVGADNNSHDIKHYVIKNEILELAQKQLTDIIRR